MKNIIPFKKEIFFKTNISEITSISLEHELSIQDHEITGEFIVSGDYKISDNSMTVDSFNYNLPFDIILGDEYDTSKAIVDIDDFYYEVVDDKILSVSIDVCVDKLSEVLIPEEIPNLEEKKDVIEELFLENNRDVLISSDNNDSSWNSKNLVLNDSLNNILTVNNDVIDNEKKDDRCIEDDDVLPGKEEIDKMDEKLDLEVKENKNIDGDVKEKFNSLFSGTFEGDAYVSYNVYIIRDGDTIESIMEKYSVTDDDLKKYNNLSDLKLGDKIIIPAK